MSCTYLFFRPARLPLQADELSSATVLNLGDNAALRAALRASFPAVHIDGEGVVRVDCDGRPLEFVLPRSEDDTLVLRGSLRVDHSSLVQQLCDRWGWLATDERPRCFQPHRAPMPV